ncbi:MAG: TPR end-of-group domain-containing protein [Acidobacteriaceae bacterium]
MRETKQAAGTQRAPRTLAGKAVVTTDAARTQALQQYESALRLMQERKFEKAKAILEKLLAGTPGDMAERIRVYIAACDQQMDQTKNQFTNLEEQYDYAISLLNTGYYDDARQELEAILKQNKAADYAHYGLAILASMTGQAERCLEHLTEAIQLNPRNRIQARGDSDFQDMADDPRFTELLYPEVL